MKTSNSKQTFKFAIGSSLYNMTKMLKDNGETTINVRKVKVYFAHASAASEMYTIIDEETGIEKTVSKNTLFVDKEELYKEIDKVFDI